MSSSWATVRFPDGRVRYSTYSGTVDLLNPVLSHTITLAGGRHRARGGWDHTEPVGFDLVWDVEIYADYGQGFWWKGKSYWNTVCTGSTDPFDTLEKGTKIKVFDGKPDWLR